MLLIMSMTNYTEISVTTLMKGIVKTIFTLMAFLISTSKKYIFSQLCKCMFTTIKIKVVYMHFLYN